MFKIPKIDCDLLNAYKKIDGKEISGKSLSQISEELKLEYNSVYIMNVTSILIKKGLLSREIRKDGTIIHCLTVEGNKLLLFINNRDKKINDNLKQDIIKLQKSNGIQTVIANLEKEDKTKDIKEEPKKVISKGFNIDEKDKEKAILNLINDTLLKTVVYCKDLSDQLETPEKKQHLIDVELELNNTKIELRRSNAIVAAYEKDLSNIREKAPNFMDLLKCGVDSRIDDFFDLIPWQRELAKGELKKDMMILIEEALQDIKSTILPEDTYKIK